MATNRSKSTTNPLQFHDIHGTNIKLLNNKTCAHRSESFGDAICFSNRPIAINESVRCQVKLMESTAGKGWSSGLRFGFTSIDPGTLKSRDLPRWVCPDMTNKPGTWAKGLGESEMSERTILLHFWVNETDDILYCVNKQDKCLLLSGVNTSGPLWAVLDVYGVTEEVEFLNTST